MGKAIRVATEEDLQWLHNGFDEVALARIDAEQLEEAINASPTPPHWIVDDHADHDDDADDAQ